jgi:hypothetical protein
MSDDTYLAERDRKLADDRRLDPYRCPHCGEFHNKFGYCPWAAERGREFATRPHQPERNEEIRRRSAEGESQRSLAQAFRISPARVSKIVRGHKR